MNKQFTIKGLPNDLLTSEIVNERRLKTNGTPKDFSIEVGLGNVKGFSTAAVVMRTPKSILTTSDDFHDVWGGGTIAGAPLDMILPTTSETWTIESTSPDDVNLTGTGAWVVLIQSLAMGYIVQSPETVSLNGTNKVTIAGTHYRPHHLASGSAAIVIQANPDPAGKRSNKGDLIVRDSITNNIRIVIKTGVSKSEDGHIAVPAGITLLGLVVPNPWNKDQSGEITNFVTPSTPNAATVQTGVFPAYQNDLTIRFEAKFRSSEKTDRIFRAKPDNDGAQVTIVEEFYVIENDVADMGLASSMSQQFIM
jgi:hypothetical protein